MERDGAGNWQGRDTGGEEDEERRVMGKEGQFGEIGRQRW